MVLKHFNSFNVWWTHHRLIKCFVHQWILFYQIQQSWRLASWDSRVLELKEYFNLDVILHVHFCLKRIWIYKPFKKTWLTKSDRKTRNVQTVAAFKFLSFISQKIFLHFHLLGVWTCKMNVGGNNCFLLSIISLAFVAHSLAFPSVLWLVRNTSSLSRSSIFLSGKNLMLCVSLLQGWWDKGRVKREAAPQDSKYCKGFAALKCRLTWWLSFLLHCDQERLWSGLHKK